jgi:hypothetical protein
MFQLGEVYQRGLVPPDDVVVLKFVLAPRTICVKRCGVSAVCSIANEPGIELDEIDTVWHFYVMYELL